ncbi:protocatechuate 3,4-dioxygenase subunit alpha [Dongia deserti]|uniref:protocatechuate 3,4-dioxygenase subunit alpha n=1 Tax=Dongia deserti TaxID=2268030 RepID=UPI000E65A728|nr:protocatechuate 3,4-dioxygenase subunit alpha [Dongia deserti]
MALKETPSQTAGPFVHIGTLPEIAGLKAKASERRNILARDGTLGERIRIEGVIYDGACALVKDAVLEIWQANANGQYGSNDFVGWGRAATDFKTGLYVFETIKPGATPYRDGRGQAPHISLSIFARGINTHLQTRLYFSDEATANAADPVLQLVGQPDLIATLIAQRDASRPVYRFDIRLQGERETVFFDF